MQLGRCMNTVAHAKEGGLYTRSWGRSQLIRGRAGLLALPLLRSLYLPSWLKLSGTCLWRWRRRMIPGMECCPVCNHAVVQPRRC